MTHPLVFFEHRTFHSLSFSANTDCDHLVSCANVSPNMPDDLWKCIFSFLNPSELRMVRLVSKNWKRLSKSYQLWESLLLRLNLTTHAPNDKQDDSKTLSEQLKQSMPLMLKQTLSNFVDEIWKNLSPNQVSCFYYINEMTGLKVFYTVVKDKNGTKGSITDSSYETMLNITLERYLERDYEVVPPKVIRPK